MPPVSIETGSPYDIMMSNNNANNLQQLQMSEASPLKNNKYEHNNVNRGGSTFSGDNNDMGAASTGDLFSKAVKREKSKRRKQQQQMQDNDEQKGINNDNMA